MSRAEGKPVVLVPACNRQLRQHPFHIAGRDYVDYVRLAGALPLVVPNAAADDLGALLDMADGVLLTGSASNVHPQHYGEGVQDASMLFDDARDCWTLPLVPQLLARGIPLLAICRGTQETNVALGGSLHQAVHHVPGHIDHRPKPGAPAEIQFGPAHEVEVCPGGVLDRELGRVRFVVNSLHGQGVNRLAAQARVEARSPDGLVEAFSVANAPGFNLCVQWHPEWQAGDNPASRRIAAAFGDACRAYRRHRPGI